MTRTATARKPAAAPAAAFPFPPLAKGEVYAGVLIAGEKTHHLVLLPGDEQKNWKDAIAWAKKLGGGLPTRKEQALLFANAAGHFQERWYWSSETHARAAGSAWVQLFGAGHQSYGHKDDDFSCRAVRRVQI